MIYKHMWQIVLTFLLPFASIAQNIHIDYIKPYGGSQYDEISNMVLENTGNIVIAGNSISLDYNCTGRASSSDTFQYRKDWISKMDNVGNTLYSKGGEFVDSQFVQYCKISRHTTDQNHYVSGIRYFYKRNFLFDFCTSGYPNFSLFKHDNSGNLSFSRCYREYGNEFYSTPLRLQNGDIHIIKLIDWNNDYVHDFPGTGIPGEKILWILTVDSLGNVKYSHNYNYTLATYGFWIKQVVPLTANSNNSVLCYQWQDTRLFPPYDGISNTKMNLVNEHGQIYRQVNMGFSEEQNSNFIHQKADKTLVINAICKQRNLIEYDGLNHHQAYIIFADTQNIYHPPITNAIKYWENNMRPEFMNTKLLSSEALYNESDSTYIIYGQMLRGISDVYPYGISSDAFIMKIDTMGNLRYIKYISSNPSLDPNIINDITVTSCLSNLIKLPNENSYIGQIVPEPNGVNGGNLGRFIGDYAGMCNRGYDCSHNGTAGEPLIIRFSEWPTGVNSMNTPAPKAQLFPNPAQDILLVNTTMQSATQKLIQFNILDVSSKILFSQKIESEHNHTIPINTLQPGFYLLQITYSDNNIHKQVSYKFIKQK